MYVGCACRESVVFVEAFECWSLTTASGMRIHAEIPRATLQHRNTVYRTHKTQVNDPGAVLARAGEIILELRLLKKDKGWVGG